jgi:dTDP-D-glucose 4,6-dehydratase
LHTFETGIIETINWYRENQNWIKAVTRQTDNLNVVEAHAQMAGLAPTV